MSRYLFVFLSLLGVATAGPMPDRNPDNDLNAIARVESGDIKAATALLDPADSSPKETLPWYRQCAETLILRAFSYKTANEPELSRRAGAAARQLLLYRLERPDSNDSRGERAELLVTLGRISDGILGDMRAARQYYLQALVQVPDHSFARAALARYKAYDEQQQRLQGRAH